MALRDQPPDPDAGPYVRQAAHNLRRARRHALALERLAVAILAFGLVFAVLTAAIEPPLAWPAAAGALLTTALWGLLRAQALQLHLVVDQTMVALEDEPSAAR